MPEVLRTQIRDWNKLDAYTRCLAAKGPRQAVTLGDLSGILELVGGQRSLKMEKAGHSPGGAIHPPDCGAMRRDSALNRSHQLFDRIFRNVWCRKTYHFVAGGVLVTLVAILDRSWLLALCLCWLTIFGILSKRISTSVVGLALLNLVSDSYLTRLGATVIFVVGDGLATVVGVAFGSRKLPWSAHKTILGSVSFLVSACVAMAAVLRLVVQPAPQDLLALTFWPSLAGCLAEAVPFPLIVDIRDLTPDDNLPVVLASGGVLYLLTKCAA